MLDDTDLVEDVEQCLTLLVFHRLSVLRQVEQFGVFRDQNLVKVADEEFDQGDVPRVEIDRATLEQASLGDVVEHARDEGTLTHARPAYNIEQSRILRSEHFVHDFEHVLDAAL